MAVEISNGTTVSHATDYADLLSKLKTFATANGWTSLEDSSDKLVLQGEGTGSDEIIVAFQKYSNSGTGAYGWRLNGYAGYTSSGDDFLSQPGAIQLAQSSGVGYPSLALWNTTIPYWFIVSGRRIIVIAKVSTTYQMAYLGFYLPFASPNQYPYPLFVGGSFLNGVGAKSGLYSGSNGFNSNFFTTNGLSITSGIGTQWTRLPGGAWYSIQNGNTPSVGMYPYNQVAIDKLRQAVDDDPILTPIEIHQSSVVPTMHHRLGELDGVFHVSGFGQSSEDIITIDATDYMVVQNVFRTGTADYCAVRLT